MSLEGKVWRYGDNVDTDVIIPARYLNSFDPKELASHCMVDIDETFAKEVKAGDIMVGGKNFGCGSSREHAPIAIKASGIPVRGPNDISNRCYYRYRNRTDTLLDSATIWNSCTGFVERYICDKCLSCKRTSRGYRIGVRYSAGSRIPLCMVSSKVLC